MVLYKTGEKLTKLSDLDLDRAKAVATKQMRGHFTKDKVPNEDLNHWVKMAADLVCTHPSLSKKDESRERDTETGGQGIKTIETNKSIGHNRNRK